MLPLTKRQREILDYLNEFISQHGYAPSLEEIGRRFGLSSLATVHKHLTNLQEKGFIKRAWNRSRSVEMMPTRTGGRAVELPLLGYVAAGLPIEAVASNETIAVPEDLVGRRDTYVLRVRGDSMIDEQIRDGDFVVVEDRKTADNGEMVIALLRGSDIRSRSSTGIRRKGQAPARQRRDAADLRRSDQSDSGRRRGGAQVLDSSAWPMTKQINFTIVPAEDPAEGAPRTYANFCSIAHTPFDFTLTFCEVMPLSEKEIKEAESEHVVRAPVRAKIVVPVQFVPNLIAAMQEHWRVFSESYSNVGWNKGPVH
jgi:repressor LexA